MNGFLERWGEAALTWRASGRPGGGEASGTDRALFWLSMVAYAWLSVGRVLCFALPS